MLSSFIQSRFTRAVFAFLVLSASSGVATLVRTCTMRGMDCCATAAHSNQCACNDSPSLMRGIAVRADLACHTTKVLGGLTINAALVEKENKTRQHNASVDFVIPSPFDLSSTYLSFSHLRFALAVPHSPPAVEKYILNASFLI